MFDYFVEGRGEVKRDEQSNVAIRVDSGSIQGGAVVVPGRRAAMCGDPQDTITNGCGFEQYKSEKNRLICSEDLEQVARVSVHCKLGTRATQNIAYRCWRGGVKCSLSRRGDPILSCAVYAGDSELMMRGDRDSNEPSRPGLMC
ncbi:hypothetical protein [Gimesia sp.]|uniref:hypothetical protein n=1 Tax=Gimesia sp. TaxID=2024833 RepID=UPI003A8E97DB